jgi:hypothetical protein
LARLNFETAGTENEVQFARGSEYSSADGVSDEVFAAVGANVPSNT